MRIWGVLFERGQSGWRCSVTFTHATEAAVRCETATGHARWRWLAYLRARREATRLHRELGAKPGERTAMGWAE